MFCHDHLLFILVHVVITNIREYYDLLHLIDAHINNIGQSDIIKQRLFQITYSMYMHKHKIITFCNKMNHRKHRNRNLDVSAPILNTHSRVYKYQVKSF